MWVSIVSWQGTLTPPDTWSRPILGLAYVLVVVTNPFPELVVIFPDYALYVWIHWRKTSACFGTSLSNILDYFVWLRIPDEGSVPEICIWSILSIKSDLKWCIHLSASLFIIEYPSVLSRFCFSVLTIELSNDYFTYDVLVDIGLQLISKV